MEFSKKNIKKAENLHHQLGVPKSFREMHQQHHNLKILFYTATFLTAILTREAQRRPTYYTPILLLALMGITIYPISRMHRKYEKPTKLHYTLPIGQSLTMALTLTALPYLPYLLAATAILSCALIIKHVAQTIDYNEPSMKL